MKNLYLAASCWILDEVIAKHTAKISKLSFAEADLRDEQIWYDLTHGIDFVQHIASPFPRALPKQESELIIPAKEGTLNILRAASANKVKRVVLTSFTAAIVYGKEKNHRSGTYNESKFLIKLVLWIQVF